MNCYSPHLYFTDNLLDAFEKAEDFLEKVIKTFDGIERVTNERERLTEALVDLEMVKNDVEKGDISNLPEAGNIWVLDLPFRDDNFNGYIKVNKIQFNRMEDVCAQGFLDAGM